MSNGAISADEAARKAQIDAVNRDYVLQPRLGIQSYTAYSSDVCTTPQTHFACADYRTIGGVSGPLVIVDSVKVFCDCA